MTIALSINVNDGIVLASDSASSLIVSDDEGKTTVQNIYNNADKIYNLYKGLPKGAMTWGQVASAPHQLQRIGRRLDTTPLHQ